MKMQDNVNVNEKNATDNNQLTLESVMNSSWKQKRFLNSPLEYLNLLHQYIVFLFWLFKLLGNSKQIFLKMDDWPFNLRTPPVNYTHIDDNDNNNNNNNNYNNTII